MGELWTNYGRAMDKLWTNYGQAMDNAWVKVLPGGGRSRGERDTLILLFLCDLTVSSS